MWYGQLVIGPPGSGKSTYCNGMQQLLRALNRPHVVINLDPANESLPYDCSIALQELLPHTAAMHLFSLGPNGALIYCVEHLLANMDWLEEKLREFKGHYLLFDCPGQVEVYTHNDAMRRIVEKLQRDLDVRLTAVHVVDSTLCTDGFKYISALLVSLSGQLLLELPHVNVLSKIDLLRHHRRQLRFRLEYFAEAQDLQELVRAIESEESLPPKMKDLTALLCELIEDYNLVSFHLLDIQDKHSVLRLLKAVDLANGYSLGHLAADLSLFHVSLDNAEDSADILDTIQERYVGSDSSEEEKDEGAEPARGAHEHEKREVEGQREGEEDEGAEAAGGAQEYEKGEEEGYREGEEDDKAGAHAKKKEPKEEKGSSVWAAIAGGTTTEAEKQEIGSLCSRRNQSSNRTRSVNSSGCSGSSSSPDDSQRRHDACSDSSQHTCCSSSAVSSSSSSCSSHCSANSHDGNGFTRRSCSTSTVDKNTSSSSDAALQRDRSSSSAGITSTGAGIANAAAGPG